MAILKIVKYGDDILRQKLKPVDYNQLAPQLPMLLKDMEETCLAVRGVGLAANQIGLPYRLAVILLPAPTKKTKTPTNATSLSTRKLLPNRAVSWKKKAAFLCPVYGRKWCARRT